MLDSLLRNIGDIYCWCRPTEEIFTGTVYAFYCRTLTKLAVGKYELTLIEWSSKCSAISLALEVNTHLSDTARLAFSFDNFKVDEKFLATANIKSTGNDIRKEVMKLLKEFRFYKVG